MLYYSIALNWKRIPTHIRMLVLDIIWITEEFEDVDYKCVYDRPY